MLILIGALSLALMTASAIAIVRGDQTPAGRKEPDMFRCARCGTKFEPLQAAVLAFCPHCRAADRTRVALVTKVVKDASRHHPAPLDD